MPTPEAVEKIVALIDEAERAWIEKPAVPERIRFTNILRDNWPDLREIAVEWRWLKLRLAVLEEEHAVLKARHSAIRSGTKRLVDEIDEAVIMFERGTKKAMEPEEETL